MGFLPLARRSEADLSAGFVAEIPRSGVTSASLPFGVSEHSVCSACPVGAVDRTGVRDIIVGFQKSERHLFIGMVHALCSVIIGRNGNVESQSGRKGEYNDPGGC